MKQLTADAIGFYVKIFDNDEDLKLIMDNYQMYNDSDNKYTFFHNLIKLFIEDEDLSVLLSSGKTSIEMYNEEYAKFLDNEAYHIVSPFYKIQKIILDSYQETILWNISSNEGLYTQLIYTFLYGNVKNYFYENRKKFLPEYEWFLIENNEQKRIHIESFFKEFDKFATIINYISDLTDLDTIPDDMLAYLSSILGIKLDLEKDEEGYIDVSENYFSEQKIQQEHTILFNHYKIRSLLKNIVSVYRSKGSVYSYELFFNSIGIDIVFKETYFDRRLFWYSYIRDSNTNLETRENRISDFAFYLTTKNPARTYYAIRPEEKVLLKNMTSPKMRSAFDYVVKNTGISDESIRKILGYEEGSEETFTYFKTNILLLDFGYLGAKFDEEWFISKKHKEVLRDYVDMITPVYIQKYYQESISGETSFIDPVSLSFYSPDGYRSFVTEDDEYLNFERSFVNVLAPGENSELEYENSEIEDEKSAKDKLSLSFKAGEDSETIERSYYVLNGKSFDRATDDPFTEDVDYGGASITYINKQEIDHLFSEEFEGFNFFTPYSEISKSLTFSDSEKTLLGNTSFEWEPEFEYTEVDTDTGEGYIIIDYYDYFNAPVAVELQDGDETIELTIT